MTTTVYIYSMLGVGDESPRQSYDPPTDIDIACIAQGDLSCIRVECSGCEMEICELTVVDDEEDVDKYLCKWALLRESRIENQEEDKLPYHSFS